jgi:replicative DNA helicase
VTLGEYLEARRTLDDAGGLAYLVGIAKDTPSAANVQAYAEIVHQRAQLRAARRIFVTGAERLDAEGLPALSDIQAQLERATTTPGGDVKFDALLRSALDQAKEAMAQRRSGTALGVPSSLPAIDRRLTAAGPKLIVVAGRPSLGKTALAWQWLLYAAHHGHVVGFVSLEMGPEELGMRALGHVYKLNHSALLYGDETALAELTEHVDRRNIRDLPIYAEFGATTLPEIIGRITEWKRRYHIRIAAIDYLQLISTRGENRNHEIGAITRALKQTAKRLDLPIILLSQFNRANVRLNRHPSLVDLRDSGEIENDADCVLALHGDIEQALGPMREIEIGILKNRGGRTGWLQERFHFNGATQTFQELTDYGARYRRTKDGE